MNRNNLGKAMALNQMIEQLETWIEILNSPQKCTITIRTAGLAEGLVFGAGLSLKSNSPLERSHTGFSSGFLMEAKKMLADQKKELDKQFEKL